MGLFDKLEQLINEHGSAVIQEKHNAFFRDELAMLKEKFTTIKQENTSLKGANEKLETENKKLITERNVLRENIKEYEDGYGFIPNMVVPIDGIDGQQR